VDACVVQGQNAKCMKIKTKKQVRVKYNEKAREEIKKKNLESNNGHF
jgi:hypothetical protein